MFENNNLANGYREFYRKYVHLHGHHTSLQELDRACSEDVKNNARSYLRRHVHRQMSAATTATHSQDYDQDFELTLHLLTAPRRTPTVEHCPAEGCPAPEDQENPK
ncbi:hypothetical protein CBL_12133 [Carabus blaptoides fortunei]